MNRFGVFGAVLCALTVAGGAQAATYNFDVDYHGGGSASLASGSDNMLGISFVAGDTINYTITSAGTGHWTTLTAGAPFINGAIGDFLGSFGIADYTYSASFLDSGSTVFSASGSGDQGTADLGPRSLAYPDGMNFDTFTETLDVTSLSDGTGTFLSILPVWPESAPELYDGGRYFSFSTGTSAVPEPLTLSLFGAGLAGAVAMRRRRKKV